MKPFLVVTLGLLTATVPAWAHGHSSSHPVTPEFRFIAPGWLDPQTIDMSDFWASFGFQETGTNYYAEGGPNQTSPVWRRFKPQNPLYQTWFGVYVIDNFSFASEWWPPPQRPNQIANSVQRAIDLTNVDQTVWLAGLGDPHPNSSVVPGSVRVREARNGFFRVDFTLTSDSDVGDPGFETFLGPAYPSPPDWNTLVPSYEAVTIPATEFIKFDRSANQFLIIYYSGVHFAFLDGSNGDTPAFVKAEQAVMARNVRFSDGEGDCDHDGD